MLLFKVKRQISESITNLNQGRYLSDNSSIKFPILSLDIQHHQPQLAKLEKPSLFKKMRAIMYRLKNRPETVKFIKAK